VADVNAPSRMRLMSVIPRNIIASIPTVAIAMRLRLCYLRANDSFYIILLPETASGL
jgi:hypothetical protein